MTDTSESEGARFFVEGHLRTDRSGLVEYYVGSLKILSLALIHSGIAQHKGPGTRLTLTGVPTNREIEQGDMSEFLKALLQLDGTVCALDISLRRNVEGWFCCSDSDKGPRVFKHIRKLYIRFPKEPEDQSPNEPEDQSPDDQSPNEPKDQSPKASLEEVIQLLKESLAPENKFPNLEELHISGLNEASILKAENDASIGCSLFMVLINNPYTPPDPSWRPKSKQGPPEQPMTYHIAARRDLEDDSEDGIVIRWEDEKPKELLLQVPDSESNTGSPP